MPLTFVTERRIQERKVSLWIKSIPKETPNPSTPLLPPHPYATFPAIDVINFALSKSYHPHSIHKNPKGTLSKNIGPTVHATIQQYKVLQQLHIAAKFTEEQIKCRDRIL
ncbi:uncharacterized protein LAESUDRAFT_765645 [Laetiporus sulphureus 93-53]|uniref:Uncharacterized protein n=1 Tax=Laetiporus sulphureus 93-53 TaxID=1314785 RepID=A0A165ANJ7_9APHY|nr:uncharacterized protein LAESUDRAFT_765645 [Laetiporus sulphureus 93-53]KZS99353.1 hypothetical protein LAESUDRAFT_765645 [Laetiporus sulphureus 93-53]